MLICEEISDTKLARKEGISTMSIVIGDYPSSLEKRPFHLAQVAYLKLDLLYLLGAGHNVHSNTALHRPRFRDQ